MISRRRFLEMFASSAAAMLFGTSLFADQGLAERDSLIAGEYFLIGDGARGGESLFGLTPYSSQPGAVRIWRFGQGEVLEIKLPFFPHSFAAHPNASHRVITFEKWGRHLAEIDLATMSVVRVTQARSGRRFFGHGAHSGEYIYATQMADEGMRGIVSFMDSADHKVVHEFETQGAFPHDCQWLPGTNTLLIVNSRRSGKQEALPENYSSLVWMDAKAGKCLKQLFVETREFGYAHLAQSADGYMALSGSYDVPQGGSQPLLSVIRPDGSVHTLNIAASTHEQLKGEVLSLYLDAHDARLTATLPNAFKIQSWNYRTGKFIRQIKTGEPRGLSYSMGQRKLVASSVKTKGFLMLDNRLNAMPVASGFGGAGSHICRINI